LLASIPNVQNYRAVLRSATGRWHYRSSGLFDRTHLRYFARRSAIAMMTATGFSLVAVGRAFGPYPIDRNLFSLSLGLLAPWVTMQNLVLVCKTKSSIRASAATASTKADRQQGLPGCSRLQRCRGFASVRCSVHSASRDLKAVIAS